MSVYNLITNATAGQTIVNVPSVDGSNSSATEAINQIVMPQTTPSNNPSQTQGFQLTVKGTGSVSATAHIVASNDGINWGDTGVTVTASASTSISIGLAGSQNTPFNYFGAYISAISGTGARASLTMSA